ncbi:MAG TPA: c-type cytochrome, partial [Puia sp.]|nr:c-type cytochrome [Puia sp.]
NHFTAGNGQSIFRGDKLPASLLGDYLINEPVARIIRRARVTDREGKVTLKNAYQQDEFIASSDMNFRPVNTYTAPDGCLYIVDMNRGIIQESEWTKADSYLRPQIQRLGLDKNTQFGRIYRLVYDGLQPGPKPQMLDEPSNKLVSWLDHPNGWWRDNAQKELVLRGDQSVVPDLKQIAVGNQGSLTAKPTALGRLHALWTLDGLDATDKEVLFKAMEDPDEQVRRAAVRISEPFLKKNDEEVIDKLEKLKDDDGYDVRVQLMLSLGYAKTDKSAAIMKYLLDKNPRNEMLTAVKSTLTKNEDIKKFGAKLGSLDPSNRKVILDGATIYRTLCSSCHGPDGKGLATQVAPPLVVENNFRRLMSAKDTTIMILLHGLKGPVNGKSYAVEMPSMASNNDQWIASVLSYIRYDLGINNRFPGNMSASFLARVMVSPDEVKKIRAQTAGRDKPWTMDDLKKGTK